ncbi:MAG TPA: DUF5715 family protein [Terracidiphilus sp.]
MALHAAVVEQPAAEPIRSSAALNRPEADIPAVQSEPVAAGSTGMAHADAQTEAAPAGEAPAARGSQPSTEAETTEDLAPDHSAAPGAETEEASLYIPRGAMPPPLRGSLESLERQNEKLTSEGLERIEDEDDLAARIADGLLVPVPASGSLVVNGNLPLNHRYCRPWTAHFLADLAEAHDAVFHRPLEVSSAVRTVAYQKRLMRVNGNAAPAEGDIVSPHLTGATVDIAKEGMTRAEMGWMRNRLMALEAEGKIDVEEEFHQRCFHITVYTSYAPHAVHRVTPSRAQTPPDSPKGPDTKPEVTGDVATQGQ